MTSTNNNDVKISKPPTNLISTTLLADEQEEEEFVKLVSAEGHQFIVPRRIALVSNTMRAMLEGQFREADQGIIHFPDISGHIL